MWKSALTALVAGTAFIAVPAFAECDATQEKIVGKAVAKTVAADAGKLVDADARPVIDLDRCEGGSTHFDTHFKVKTQTPDGKDAWVEGRARGTDDRVETITYRKASTELASMAQGAAVASR